MEQIKENMDELMKTIQKYGKMPINPERTAFLANCWAAYNALCMVCETAADAPHIAKENTKQSMGL